MSNERVIFSVVSNTNVYLARVSVWNDIKERQRHPTRHPPPLWLNQRKVIMLAKLRLVDVLQICKHADKFMLGFQ